VPQYGRNQQCAPPFFVVDTCHFISDTIYCCLDSILCNDSIPPVPPHTKSSLGTLSSNDNSVTAYPNPVVRGSVFDLRYVLPQATTLEVAISDMIGREIYRSSKEYPAGETIIPVNTSGWSTGRYLVKMTAGEKTFTQRVVVTDK
jgi:hypothetical protein